MYILVFMCILDFVFSWFFIHIPVFMYVPVFMCILVFMHILCTVKRKRKTLQDSEIGVLAVACFKGKLLA